MDLSIIIVNWRSRDFLRKCLQTVFECTKGIIFEVIVVDNASFDGCEKMLSEEFSQVRFIQSHTNSGFAAANNLGTQSASGDVLLFLNPDTEIRGNALAEMAAVLKAHSDGGITGARLLNSDGTLQDSCVQSYPTIINQVLDADLLRKMFPRLSVWGNKPLYNVSSEPVTVEAVSGACLMIKREIFQKVGGFTTDYFMYSEDIDLCKKVEDAGWKSYYVPDAVVVHHGGGSSAKGKGGFTPVMIRQSMLKFLRRYRGELYAFLFQGIVGLAAVGRLALLGLVLIATLGRFRRQELTGAIANWIKIFRWSLGLEGWARRLT